VRHRRLAFGRPGNQVITKKNAETRGGFFGIRTTSPISIGVCNEIKRGRLMDFETKVGGALHIAKNAFDELEMCVPWIMHKEANLLDSVGYIWTCEGEILEGTS
jgi:hypothetical protein